MISPSLTVDALLFDFGGVLVSCDFSRAFAAWASAANVTPAALSARFTFDAHYEAHERGEIDGTEYFAALKQSLGVDLSDQELLEGWNAIFVAPLPGMPALLRSLAARRPLYLFSNTNRLHHACWSKQFADVLAPFSAVFCSHEVGLRKPSVQAFHAVAARAGHPPDRIAFFDDLEENVQGARAAGLRAFCVRSTEDVERALASLGWPSDEHF